MARAYHVLYRRVPLPGGDDPVDHSAAALTFDRSGRFVDAIPSGEDEPLVLARLEALPPPLTNRLPATTSVIPPEASAVAVQPGETR